MIEIKYKDIRKSKKNEKIIENVINKVLEIEKIKHPLDIYITLTTNEEIHKINKEYRGIDRATDVLSFPLYERENIPDLKKKKKDDIEEILGDIIVSIPKVIEQSKEYGHSFERELAYLVTHGMLHLLGYDHIIDEEKNIMRAREEMILKKLDISRD